MSNNNPYLNCLICGSKAPENRRHLCHYGAVCCLGCKAFFRRIIQNKGTFKFFLCLQFTSFSAIIFKNVQSVKSVHQYFRFFGK